MLDVIFIILFSYLCFIEKPEWCIQRKNFMVEDCQMDLYGNQYNLFIYYSFNSQYIFFLCCMVMSYFNLKYLVSYSFIQKTNNFFNSNRKKRLFFCTLLNILHFFFHYLAEDQIIELYMTNLIRIFYFFVIIDFFYVNIQRLINYLVSLWDVLLLFLMDWFLVAAIMEVMFVGFSDYYDSPVNYTFNFENYQTTLFTMFVFLTGNNSPEIYLKQFPESFLLNFSLIFLIWLNNLLLLGVMIGISQYKIHKEQRKLMENLLLSDFKTQIFKQLQSLPKASQEFVKEFI